MLNEHLKQHPFSVPEGYFEALQERVESRTSMLGSELKQNPFSVPEGYFESLQERTAEKISPQTVVLVKHRSWRTQLALAASFALLVAMSYGIMTIVSKSEQAPRLVEDDMYALLKTVSPFINEAALIDAVLGVETPILRISNVKNDDIISYLADGHLSIYDIAAALE